jgi:hypothetical protein
MLVVYMQVFVVFRALESETKITELTEVKVLMVEHLENSSPLIIEEVRRWRDLLWDDYLDYKYREKRSTDVHNPLGL